MAIEPADISTEEYNRRVASWTTATGMKIRAALKSLTHAGKGDLVKSLRGKNDTRFVEIDRIAFHFARHGVFLHKGVGRGYIMQGGTVVRGYKPGKVLTAMALNSNREVKPVVLKGSVNRKAVEWFNPIVQENIEKLADLVAEMRADQVVSATKIMIR
jgi:hypothetical protein